MDTNNTYDLGRLNQDELFELRELQAKMRGNGQPEDLDRLTVEELRRLVRLYHKMAGEQCPLEGCGCST